RDYNRLFLSLFFPHNCIIDSLSQSFLVELLPYLMQLLFDSLKFLAINFSVACICSLCQLIDVITNRSQLLFYLNRPRFINLGGLHAIPQCPLFRMKPPKVDKSGAIEIAKQLRAIGNNVNQLTKRGGIYGREQER